MTLEKNNIGDDIIAILVNLDPLKVGNNGNVDTSEVPNDSSLQVKSKKTLTNNTSIDVTANGEEENFFALSGLI